MVLVNEYRKFVAQCHEMAARTNDPLDRKILELQAAA
jgi:hypothetical protein